MDGGQGGEVSLSVYIPSQGYGVINGYGNRDKTLLLL